MADRTPATPPTSPKPPMLLLVHGAWHAGACWGRTQLALAARGLPSVAIDLPGHGLDAAVPASYLQPGQAGFDTEPSPVAGATLDGFGARIVEALERLRDYEVTLVSHSAGGGPASVAVEQAPDLVAHQVYLSAFCPAGLPVLAETLALPEASEGLVFDAVVGDPVQLGAFRINPASTDADYVEILRAGYYSDLPADEFLPWRRILLPDFPVSIGATPALVSAERWGRVPRTFVYHDDDRVAVLALQEFWVREADAAMPQHPFATHRLPTGHAAFASRPDELADLLADIVRGRAATGSQ